MLTLGRSSYSSDIANSPTTNITPHQNTYKILNHKDMIDITSKLISTSQRSNKFGLVVSGMLLQLLNVEEGETSAEISFDLDGNLESKFPRMIERYKISIKEAKLGKQSEFTSLKPPSKPLAQYLGCKGRLKPTVEKNKFISYHQ